MPSYVKGAKLAASSRRPEPRSKRVVDGKPFCLEYERDSGSAVYASLGKTMKLLELARHMIVTSNNLATNLLLDLVGVEQVRATLADLGVEGVDVRRGVVLGEVTGNVTASEKVDIRDNGSVDGDIASPRIAIAEGAHFRGSVDMQRAGAAAAKPQHQQQQPSKPNPTAQSSSQPTQPNPSQQPQPHGQRVGA